LLSLNRYHRVVVVLLARLRLTAAQIHLTELDLSFWNQMNRKPSLNSTSTH
jgi:hypothetical protein